MHSHPWFLHSEWLAYIPIPTPWVHSHPWFLHSLVLAITFAVPRGCTATHGLYSELFFVTMGDWAPTGYCEGYILFLLFIYSVVYKHNETKKHIQLAITFIDKVMEAQRWDLKIDWDTLILINVWVPVHPRGTAKVNPPPSLPSVLQSYVLERSLRKLKINLFFTLFVERTQSQFLVMNNPSS